MSSQILLSGGDKYYSYSGEVFGDVSAPATIPMVTIDNTGLRDSYVKIMPFFGTLVSGGTGDVLGLEVKMDNVTIIRSQLTGGSGDIKDQFEYFELFIPRNSKLELISLNTSGNNTQIRGANILGYYL